MNRIVKLNTLLAAVLLLAACGDSSDRSAPVEPTLLLAQPLSRTAERAPPFARHIAQSRTPLGGGIGGMIIGAAVNAALNQDDRARSLIGQVPSPTNVDPGTIIEAMIADHLVAEFGARPNLADFYAGSVRETTSVERAPQIAALARRRGLSGVVIDVVALEFYADSTGRNLGLVDEAFNVVVRAQMTLVDVATGAVIAQGECMAANGNKQAIVNVIEDGPSLTTLLAQKAAGACANNLISRYLR